MAIKQETNSQFFFRPYGRDGYLSNFYPVTFYMNKIEFTCSEQAFMYEKCKYFDGNNQVLLSDILQESNPNKIKKLGRKVRYFSESEWDNVKYDIMEKCLREKFIQNPTLKDKLLNTYPNELYEASPWDKIWGIGYDKDTALDVNPNKYGKNLLGKVLMDIRENLHNEKNNS